LNIQRPNIKVNKTWLMLAVAIVLSLLTTWLTLQYLKHKEESIEAEVSERAKQERGATVSVVVPTRDYPAGVVLEENMVAARPVPSDFVYDDAILASQFDSFKGQVLLRPVVRGKPLRKADVQEMFADFSDTLKVGKRAMTINVDEINSVSHMIEPGNLVDLMLVLPSAGETVGAGTHGAGTGGGGPTVVPFLDQVKVLATGQRITHDDPGAGPEKRKISYSNVTLEVTPAQAARLTLATDLGKIRAILRNEKDKQDLDYDSINAGNLLEDVRERARRAALAKPKDAEADGFRRSTSSYVQYIIGGRGNNDISTQPTNVAIPGMSGLTALNNAMAYENQANAAALSGQLPGSLGDSVKQGVGAAPAPAKSSK
jgi:pilus assembly protein CpaB